MKYLVDVVIWGYPLIILIILVSIYFGIRTRFIQLRYIKLMPKLLLEKNSDKDKISSYQTIALTLANHVGIGNILGVAGAIMYGGPGAILWMWLTAILCSGLSVVENTLGQMYKTEHNGQYRGGPAYYIYKGIGSKTWAVIIAFVLFICLGLLMPTIQAVAISTSMNNTFNLSKLVVGFFVTFTIGFIIFGESKRIIHVAEVIVPFMAIFYLLLAFIVIISHVKFIDDVFLLILDNAFNKNAFYGSIIGNAINYGIRRGIFTHEAGLGSSPNISASSNVSHPVKQGINSAFCVFIDTIVICSATAFMILVTNCFNVMGEGKLLFEGLSGLDYTSFVGAAIDTVFKNWGSYFVSISIFFFAYASLFSGFYNAETNLIFIFKSKKLYKLANILYKCAFLTIIMSSSIFNTEFAWVLTDFGVGIAAFVNIIVILLLSNKFLDVVRDFELKYKKKDDSKYFNKDLECWR